MDKRSKEIQALLDKLNLLISRQDVLAREVSEVKSALQKLQAEEGEDDKDRGKSSVQLPPAEGTGPVTGSTAQKRQEILSGEHSDPAKSSRPGPSTIRKTRSFQLKLPESIRTNLEDFIGTNLINKLGIIVLLIGIGIGTKFAIDRNLISPLVRLILGYILGGALLFFSYRLKRNYHNFSAVLCSGSMAILYFMTYAGIGFFNLFSPGWAFSIMVVITVFTVYQALAYDRQVIAVLGLLGAYAIPFLVGGEPDQYIFLFTYIAIINFGILLVAMKKYWQFLNYATFVFTWLIYVLWWQETDFTVRREFKNALVFNGVFFMIFYFSIVLSALLARKKFTLQHMVLILANTFIFYGLADSTFTNSLWADMLGFFTLFVASIHLLMWKILDFQKEPDKRVQMLVFILIVFFATLSVPQILDGSWVTLTWILEGTFLFVFGRTQKQYFYEYLAYPVLICVVLSIMHDWKMTFEQYASLDYEAGYRMFLNLPFGVSLAVIACLGFMTYINFHSKYPLQSDLDPTVRRMINYFIPGAMVFIIYYTFRFEIAVHFRQLYADSLGPAAAGLDRADLSGIRNDDLLHFKNVWILCYSMVFFAGLMVLNILRIKQEEVAQLLLLINVFVLFVFLFQGLYELSELSDSYIDPPYPDKFPPGTGFIGLRYLSILLFGGTLAAGFWQLRQDYMRQGLMVYFNLFLGLSVLWIASSELIQWLDLGGSGSSYKLGLSILWGCYSLVLISIGIWKKFKYLRIGGIILFGITLIKLSVYDVAGMDTISKTIVFILLGILLLIISFLYNKYRKIIF